MPPDPTTNPPDTPLDRDVPCQRCGYNLRGLLQSGRCPECGGAVELSLQGDLLKYANPKWLARMQHGAWLATIPFYMVIRPYFTILILFGPRLLNWCFPETTVAYKDVPMALLIVGATLCVLCGIALLARANETTENEERLLSARRVTLATAMISVIAMCGTCAAIAVRMPTNWVFIALLACGPFGVPGFVGTLAMFRYVREIERRSGLISPIATRQDGYLRGFTISWVIMAVSACGLPLTVMLGCAAFPAALGVAGFGVLLLTLPASLYETLLAARREAELAWSTQA